MPQSIKISSFKSGWCPSDDSKNGRQDGLLKMDNVELDQNGSLSMVGGISQYATLGGAAYDLFSNIIGNNRYDFIARNDGHVDYANGATVTNLFSGGDTSNTGFGTAFDYTLITSGSQKKKTNIANTYNLGVYTPVASITSAISAADHTGAFYQNAYNTQDWSSVKDAQTVNVTQNVANFDATETWTNASGSSGAPSFYSDAPAGFNSSILVNVTGGGPGQIDLLHTYSPAVNLLTSSGNPNGDVFSFWLKQTQNAVTQFQVYLTDISGNKIVYGFGTGSFPSLLLNNQWNQFNFAIRWGADGASGTNGLSFIQYSGVTFDWTQVTNIEIVCPTNIATSTNVQIAGLQFQGQFTIPAVQPTLNSGTGFPQGQIYANKMVLETAIAGPVDFNTYASGALAEDTDIFSFFFRAGVNGSSSFGDASNIASIEIDILLTNPGSNFNAGTDYFSYIWTNNGLSGNSNINVDIKRSDFTRVGTGTQQWSNVYAIMFTVVVNGPVYIAFGGSVVPGVVFANNPSYTFFGGSNSLNGTYQYVQVNVNNTGSYVAKSGAGPISVPIDVVNGRVTLAFENPSTHDTQVNQVWIYRFGGTLGQYYRIGVIQPADFANPFIDNISDTTAADTDIVLNFNLFSVQNLGKIFDIVGPIQGRWFYFTANTMWPSDINDPDLYDASLGVTTTGSSSEVFLWARKVAQATVLVGTSRDIYILTGTYVTLPDNTVDIYYRPLVVAYPPITYNATYYNNSVFYLAKDGWRSIDSNGNCIILVIPSTDLLYRGDTRYNYSPPSLPVIPGSSRFPVVVARNKLWCSITGQSRIEVYDFTRQTWQVINYGSDVTAMYSAQDGKILGIIGTTLNQLDTRSSRIASNVNILTPIFDNGQPRNRKDAYDLRIRFGPGTAGSLNYQVITDTGTTSNVLVLTGLTTPDDVMINLSQTIGICRTFQLAFSGSPSELIIEEMEIFFDVRPTELTFVRGYNDNFGQASKKRVRTWPFIINTEGNNVTLTPYVDNVAQPTLTINTTEKTTVPYFFKTDVFGVDYGYTIGGNLFELWGSLTPEVVQILPVAKQFDQVGPLDFQRYGRIQKIEFRLMPFGGTTIPYNIYMNDKSILTGNITAVSGVDDAYYIGIPKGVAGRILRIELGPTNFNFHRLGTRVLANITGMDTEGQWLTL